MAVEQHLEAAFGAAAPAHYAWQTESPFVAERERALVQKAFLPLGDRVLDLGCAEGATLYHLGSPAGAVGVDLFEDKLAFARSRLPACEFVRASAYELPFEAGRFDHVIVRDVIHHLDEPERALAEIARVLTPGGRVDVLEPCRNNPLILLHALSHKEERGELRSTLTFLRELVARDFTVEKTTRMQALPIHRLVLHPELGRPALGRQGLVRRALDLIEHAAERVMPEWSWAYVHVRGTRRLDPGARSSDP